MDVDWQLYLVLLFIFILLTALFSVSEASLFLIDRKKIKNNFASDHLISRYLNKLLEDLQRLSLILLAGKTIFISSASVIAVIISSYYFTVSSISPFFIIIVQIILLSFLIIIFGVIIPKASGTKNPVKAAKIIVIPFYLISILLFPIAEYLKEFLILISNKIKFPKVPKDKGEELLDLSNIPPRNGSLIDDEQGLIESIVSFRSVNVYEVMTPRVDITAIPIDTSFNELLNIITSSGHSRFPLYKEDLDDIIGLIYAKDLLPYIKNEELKKQISLSKLARKAMFVPKTKMVNDLLNDFQEKKMHIAVVVDEFGGTAGLISLEDIIEEIIGEIRDEYDKEENSVIKVDENNFIVLGRLSIYELNELLNANINSENEDFETAAGLVLNTAGQIPKEGYTFQLENHKFTVKEILNKRIKKIQIEKLQGE